MIVELAVALTAPWAPQADTQVVARARAFRPEARRLARDLGVTTARRAQPGDVILARGTTKPEGYRLTVTDRVTIRARDRAGAFYGGRALIAEPRPVGRGTIAAAPRYPERGMMLDNGRAFYGRPWLARQIRRLGRLGLNRFHLHFSDDQGFRVESVSHPEIVTPPFLTHADIRALTRVARRNHVQLVPEIDMPGHMTAALRAHPELELTDVTGRRVAGKLDVTKPEARRFVTELLDEYLPLFDAPVWHTGADEYLGIASTPVDYQLYPQLEAYADAKYGAGANGKDAVLDFTNFVGDHVRAQGKQLRAWSDGSGGGSLVKLDPRTSVQWWEEIHSPPPADLIAAGHDIVNTGWWPLYHVTGGPLHDHRAPVSAMRDHWEVNQFDGPISKRFASPSLPPEFTVDDPKLRGAYMAVWNDDPASPDATEEAVARDTLERLRVLAHKTWGPQQRAPG